MFADDVENVRVLLNAGADMSIKNNDGLTALGMAIKYDQEDSIKLLRSRGAPE
jgi:ankyrin repeat protein